MLKKALFLLFFVFLIAANFEISAQTKDSWKDFASEEGGFKVKFPIQPTRAISKVEMAFGKADMTQFRVITSKTAFIVGFVDFPSAIPDTEEIKMRYDLARDGLIDKNGDRLMSEREVILSDFAGRELVIQNPLVSQTVRMFIINQRMFTLIAVTETRNKTAYQASINKFLDSFELTKIPESKTEVTKLPADFGSKITGNVYRSSFFDFSIELPKEWKILSDEEIQYLLEIVNNEAGMGNTKEGKMTMVSLRRTAILAGAVNLDAASIMVGAERPDFANMTLESIAKVVRANQTSSGKDKIIKDVYPLTLGGVDFFAVDTQNIEDKSKQRIIITKRKELLFQIIFTYKDEADLKILEEAVKTVKFNSK
jgi:hypothetical protein